MTSRRGVLVAAAIASLPLACDGGCGGSGGGGAASATASAAPSEPASSVASAAAKLRPIRAVGPAGAIFRAAASLDLTREQRVTYEKIAEDLREAEKAAGTAAGDARAGMKAMQEELVAGIKAGKIDTAKLDAAKAEMDKAAKARAEREADGLNRLHAALDASQRAKIVASVREDEEKRSSWVRRGEKLSDGGRASVAFTRLRLERLTKDLGLDAEQQKKVEAFLPKDDGDKWDGAREDAKKRVDELLAAFEKDGFDAKKLVVAEPSAPMNPFDEQAKFFAQLVPILTPEQREKLAEKVSRGSDDLGGARGIRRLGGRDRDRGHGQGHGHGHGQDHDDDE